MALSYSTFNSVTKTFKKISNNIGQNQEYYLKLFLALISANLLVANIKSEVACRKEREKNELYKADLKMFTSHMKNDDWISSLSERTNDPVERPKIIKEEMAALILKCVAGLPEYLLREERKQEETVPDDDDNDDDDESVAGDAAVDALARNENSLKII